MRLIHISLLLTMLLMLGGGCKEKGPAEKAGEKIDKATEETKKKVEEGAEETE